MEQHKVIIVDNELRTRMGIAKSLPWKQLDCELAGVAENGEQALALVRAHNPEIVISDIRMPHMDGLELIEHLEREFPKIRVIFISAYSDFKYAHQALRSRIVCEYLLKPVNIGELSTAILNALHEQKAQRPAEFDVCDFDTVLDLISTGEPARGLALMERQWDAHTIGTDLSRETIAKQASSWMIRLSWLLNEHHFAPDASRYAAEYAKAVFQLDRDSIGPYCIQRTREVALQISHSAGISPMIRSCLQIIDRRFCEKSFSLFVLAEEMMLSPNYLSASFKKEMGIGFVKYLQMRRIEEAKRLLMDVRLKTYEISSRIGIDDERYFSRLFKEITTMTPSAYRQSIMMTDMDDFSTK